MSNSVNGAIGTWPLAFWVATAFCCAAPMTARAQVSTMAVMTRTVQIVGTEEDKGRQLLFIQVDNLKRDWSKSQTYNLEGGSTYRVYAVGDDNRVLDIDLAVMGEDNDLLGKDVDDQNVALVRFRLNRNQRVTFETKAYKMRSGVNDGFFSIVVTREF